MSDWCAFIVSMCSLIVLPAMCFMTCYTTGLLSTGVTSDGEWTFKSQLQCAYAIQVCLHCVDTVCVVPLVMWGVSSRHAAGLPGTA